jgi:hypothetical protein
MKRRKKPREKLTPDRLLEFRQVIDNPDYLKTAIKDLAAKMANGISKKGRGK